MALLIQLKENVALFLLCFMSLQAGSVMRLPKFEVDIPAASKAQKVQLLERDVTLANMWVITVQPKIHTSQSSLNSKIDLVTNHVCRNSDFWFHQFDFYGIIGTLTQMLVHGNQLRTGWKYVICLSKSPPSQISNNIEDWKVRADI